MKKPVTETRIFCDEEGCDELAYTQCLLCGKDLCRYHRIEVVIYLDRQDWCFRASLCRDDAQPFLPFLKSLKGKSATERQAGQNPEFNEARLVDIIRFLFRIPHVGVRA